MLAFWLSLVGCSPAPTLQPPTPMASLHPEAAWIYVGDAEVDVRDGLRCADVAARVRPGTVAFVRAHAADGALVALALWDDPALRCDVDARSTAVAAAVFGSGLPDLTPRTLALAASVAQSVPAPAVDLRHPVTDLPALAEAAREVGSRVRGVRAWQRAASQSGDFDGFTVRLDPFPSSSSTSMHASLAYTGSQVEYRAVLINDRVARYVRHDDARYWFVQLLYGWDGPLGIPLAADLDEAAPTRETDIPLTELGTDGDGLVRLVTIAPALLAWDDTLAEILVRGKVDQATFTAALEEGLLGIALPGYAGEFAENLFAEPCRSALAEVTAASVTSAVTSTDDYGSRAIEGVIDVVLGWDDWAPQCLGWSALPASVASVVTGLDTLRGLWDLGQLLRGVAFGPSGSGAFVDLCALADCQGECSLADGGVTCAPVPCDTPADCDDADACTGVEQCVDHVCVRGAAPSCAWDQTCAPDAGCVDDPFGPQLAVTPNPGDVDGCIAQGGEGFPPDADVTLVFTDGLDGSVARESVRTDRDGALAWFFGFGCGMQDAADRATAWLDRVDPQRRGVSGRPSTVVAELWDGARYATTPVDYTLTWDGTCAPTCAGRTCGDDGCGGSCGACYGTESCVTAGATATCQLAPGPGLTVTSSTISGTTTWTRANSPVRVTRDLTISGTLTIEAGVQVQFVEDADMVVSTGTLKVLGTPTAPVLFTADTTVSGPYWGGLIVQRTARAVELRHLELRHAGGDYFAAARALIVHPSNVPVIEGIRFAASRGQGITLDSGSSWSYGGVLPDRGVAYLLDRDVVIPSGATVTVARGVVIKAEEDVDISVDGALIAVGATFDPVVFTSDHDDDADGVDLWNDGRTGVGPGQWGGISFNQASSASSALRHVVIRYAASDYFAQSAPLIVHPKAAPAFEDVHFVRSRLHGATLVAGTHSGAIRLEQTAMPYLLRDDLTVTAGSSLVLGAGVIMRAIDEDVDLNIAGQLVTNGTPNRRVRLTSGADDRDGWDVLDDGIGAGGTRRWGGVVLSATSGPASTLTATDILQAGSDYFASAYGFEADPRLPPVLTDVQVRESGYNAVKIIPSTLSGASRLTALGGLAWVAGSEVIVPAGSILTIDPGAVIKLGETNDLLVHGRLVAGATGGAPVVITGYLDDRFGGESDGAAGTRCAPGAWGGVRLGYDAGQAPSVLRNVQIRCGGSGYFAEEHPLVVDLRGAVTIEGLTLSDNTHEGITAVTGSYSASVRMGHHGHPWWIPGDLTVGSTARLTIDPGVIVKIADGRSLYVDGALTASGTEAMPIVITSTADDAAGGDTDRDLRSLVPGMWETVQIKGGTAGRSDLRHVTFRYGGDDFGGTGCALRTLGEVLVERTVFEHTDDGVCRSGAGVLDLGGGSLGSAGRNRFLGFVGTSRGFAVSNRAAGTVSALGNDWDTLADASIRAVIEDTSDNAAYGRVDYAGFWRGTPAPVADDAWTVTEDVPLDVAAPGVLANDGVAGAVTVELVTPPAVGTVTLRHDGSFRYVPPRDASGPDAFTYRVTDGGGTSPAARVALTITPVADPPVAAPDLWAVAEDSSLLVAAPGVLANDSDPEGDRLTVTLLVDAAHGRVALAADGGFTWTPPADFVGVDSFQYRVSDGARAATGVVSLVVTGVPDPPRASADRFAGEEDGALWVAAPGVLANDVDPDGDALVAELIAGPPAGALTLGADGSVRYLPAADASGAVRFTYAARSGAERTAPVEVVFDLAAVNDAPAVVAPAPERVDLGAATPLVGWSLADVDAGDAAVTLRLRADAGGLTAPALAGLTTSGTFSDLTLRGPLAALIAGLPAVTWQVDQPGWATLTATLDDGGATGSGGPRAAEDRWTVDVAAPPAIDTGEAPPVLSVDAVVPGEQVLLVIDGAGPGELVTFAVARAAGAGRCFPALGGLCLDLVDPIRLGHARANPDGRAVLGRRAPDPLHGPVLFQAVARRGDGSVATNVVRFDLP